MTKFKKFFTSGLFSTVLAFILSALVIIILAFILSGEGNKHYTDEEKVFFNQFIVTEKRMQSGHPMYIMYDKDSKAMYYGCPQYQGWMVPIYNSDGSVKIYTE